MRNAFCIAMMLPFALAAQAPDSSSRHPAFTVGGYLTASYTSSTRNGDGVIAGRLYGRDHNQFMLNVGDIVIERVAATGRWDAGLRLEPTFGTNAFVVKAAGLDLGTNADILQAYAALNIPRGKDQYFQLKAGKMATLMGVEVFEDVLNPTLDVGNQTAFLAPFTELGVELDGKFGTHLDAQFRVSNGWDLFSDNNDGKTAMMRVGFSPNGVTTIAVVGFSGAEQAGNTDLMRRGIDIVTSHQVGATTAWVQVDYGEEGGIGVSGGSAKWSAVGVWLRTDLSAAATLGMRADYLNDRDGVRTSGVLGVPTHSGQVLTSATATLSIKPSSRPRTLIRPELRYDHSTLDIFGGHPSQFTASIGLSVLF